MTEEPPMKLYQFPLINANIPRSVCTEAQFIWSGPSPVDILQLRSQNVIICTHTQEQTWKDFPSLGIASKRATLKGKNLLPLGANSFL